MGKTLQVGPITFGPGRFVIIAGPCAVESEEQTLRIARAVKAKGAHVLRGGAFKPRSSPRSFQGLGLKGLRILREARAETGLPVVTEVLDVRHMDAVCQVADMIQIGARNMQNFPLLREAGRARRPVLLKRGMSATVEEWLLAAEYILEEGNSQVILCERGVRHFDQSSRFLADLGVVPIVKRLSHLPVMVDPSHSSGRKDMVAPLARAALAVGAHAVMVDVHDKPREALCDAKQALTPREFGELVGDLRKLAQAMDLRMSDTEPFEASAVPVGRVLKVKNGPKYGKDTHPTWA